MTRVPSTQAQSSALLSPLDSAQQAEGVRLLTTLRRVRDKHLYVSGLSGVGKSTFLLHLILEDIVNGTGCCVVDPHGDLIDDILARCPNDEGVLERIVLFDPSDTQYPIGLNILDASSERTQDLTIQFMIDLFMKLYLPDHQGPVLHQAMRNGLRLLMEVGGTLPELPQLFSAKALLKRRLRETDDPWVRHYFEQVWLEMSGGTQAEYLGYYTSKFSHFVEDRLLRNILGQRAGLDLPALMDQGGVLLVNLSRGAIGDLNSRLLGMLLLHKLERATLERGLIPRSQRRVFHVYIDEFHELTTTSLETFLTAARKFQVGLALAHQRLETLPLKARELILGTVANFALFRQGSGEGLGALPPLLWPRFSERTLLSVPNFQMLARVTSEEGPGRVGRITVPPPAVPGTSVYYQVRERSRARFGQERTSVEAELRERLSIGVQTEEKHVKAC
jgi:hypothetical protein